MSPKSFFLHFCFDDLFSGDDVSDLSRKNLCFLIELVQDSLQISCWCAIVKNQCDGVAGKAEAEHERVVPNISARLCNASSLLAAAVEEVGRTSLAEEEDTNEVEEQYLWK